MNPPPDQSESARIDQLRENRDQYQARLVTAMAENERLTTKNAELVEVGETFYRLITYPGCAHNDPRHPTNHWCGTCQKRAVAMNDWDDATKPAFDEERP